jgi:hypothetical protein
MATSIFPQGFLTHKDTKTCAFNALMSWILHVTRLPLYKHRLLPSHFFNSSLTQFALRAQIQRWAFKNVGDGTEEKRFRILSSPSLTIFFFRPPN